MNPRLALTTTLERSSALADSLRRRGIEPVSLPCIEIVAAVEPVLESARQASERCDLLVLTSRRVVEVLWPAGNMPPVNVAAVGVATAAAAEESGGSVGVVGPGGGADLVAGIGHLVRDKDVVFPHAAGADPSLVEQLRSAGARVTAHTVYETRPLAPAMDEVEAVVFGSPTAVEGWLLTRTLDNLVVGAIGDTTAQALARRGATSHVIPATPSFDRLLDLVAEELTDRSPV